MSRHMLSDSNTINDFNPFVMGDFSLPGASRKPQEFDKFPLPVQEEKFPVDKNSPICDYGITAGDKTIDMCRPGKPNCPLSRPLLPGRNIDRGFTDFANKIYCGVENTGKQCGLSITMMIVIFLILLIALQ